MKRLSVRRSFIDDVFERPFSLLREFERTLQNALDRLEDVKTNVWSPNVDMVENDNNYEVIVELPGVHKEDLKINLKDNILTISGEKKEQYEKSNNTQIHYRSIWYGKFYTEINLPRDADIEKIRAEFKNGILKIHIPKTEKEKGKEIHIEVKD